jgi:hypothetical protein
VGKEVIMVLEGIEVAEAEGVEGAVVEEEDHDTESNNRTPFTQITIYKTLH